MPAHRILLVALATGLALGPGCADGSGSGTSATSTTAAPAASTTTTAPAPPDTAPTSAAGTGPTRFFGGPQEAIEYLVQAWRDGNRPAALEVADQLSVDNIFTQPAEGFELYGCDSGEFDTSLCNYRNRATGGYAQITAERSDPGWSVVFVYMSTDG